MKYVITDLVWLSKFAEVLFNPNSKSDSFEIHKSIGKNVPLWQKDKLIEALNSVPEIKVNFFLKRKF